MNKLVQRFIVWYLKRHNVKFDYDNYIVRMFSTDYYNRLMMYADMVYPVNCRCVLQVNEERVNDMTDNESANRLKDSVVMPPEMLQDFCEAIEELQKSLAEAAELFEKALKPLLDAAWDAIKNYPNKRVIHLALHHGSKRVRNKNMHRIHKWMLKWMRYKGRSINGR